MKRQGRGTFPPTTICRGLPGDMEKIMFIEIDGGRHANLAHVAKVHVVESGAAGTSVKFYSLTGQRLGDATPRRQKNSQQC